MQADPEHFRQYNPVNGWGDYEGALEYLTWIRDRCRAWPKALVVASR